MLKLELVTVAPKTEVYITEVDGEELHRVRIDAARTMKPSERDTGGPYLVSVQEQGRTMHHARFERYAQAIQFAETHTGARVL